jgi:hypothetical protein
MGLFDIFKKKQTTPQPKTMSTPTQVTNSTEDDFDKSRQLLKQATSFKNTDINKAIALIEQAIDTSPERILSDYFKLANYYHISDNTDRAYSTHQNLLENLDINDIGMHYMDRSQIFDKLCTLSYKDKYYEQYLHYYCLWLYNTTVAFACQGRKEELNNIISNRDKLDYLAPTKVNGSFKRLGKESSKQEFNDKLFEYFDNQQETLTKMADKAYEIDYSSNPEEFRFNESVGQSSNRLLKKEDKFMVAYKSYNTGQFDNYFETTLRPIIKK